MTEGLRLFATIRLPGTDDVTDGQLLDRFLADRDEAAFATLVHRHGRMVLGVCQRVLCNRSDAEDAFQVTFLVLARKGMRLTERDSIGGWLYQAACLTARKARERDQRRRTREAATAKAEAQSIREQPDWHPLLDQEVAGLPPKYRDPVALCALGGETRKAAAAQLGVPEGTLSSRLATAMRLLGERLRRRGVVAPAGLVTLTAGECLSAVPAVLTSSTIRAAMVFKRFAPGSLRTAVHNLLAEVTQVMRTSTLITWFGALLAAVAVGGLAWAGLGGEGQRPGTVKPMAQSSKPPDLPVPEGQPMPKPRVEDAGDAPGIVGPWRDGEPAWKGEFRKEYGLTDGQAMKLIRGEPFPACREAYLNAEPSPYPRARHEKLLVVFSATGQRIAHRNVVIDSYGWEKEQTPRGIEDRLRGRRLWEILGDGLRISPPLLDADADLMATELYADAVFRENAPLDQVAKSLQAELRDKFQIAVLATAREEEREVIVVRGKYVHRFREGKLNGQLSVAAKDLDPEDYRGTYAILANDPAGLFRYLGEYVGRQVIDETDPASWKLTIPRGKDADVGAWSGMRAFRYPRRSRDDVRPADGSTDRDAVLKHVSAQTGITFATEKRKVWIFSVKKVER